MLTFAAKDRIARRLRGWGWLVWGVVAAGVGLAGWGVSDAWDRASAGTRATADLIESCEIVLRRGVWERAGALPGEAPEAIILYVTHQDLGTYLRTGRRTHLLVPLDTGLVCGNAPPDERPHPSPVEAAPLWQSRLAELQRTDPENWPAGLVNGGMVEEDFGVHRRIADRALVCLATPQAVQGGAFLVAALLLAWARRVTRRWGWVLGLCPACGYDLAGLGASGCPECGRGVGGR